MATNPDNATPPIPSEDIDKGARERVNGFLALFGDYDHEALTLIKEIAEGYEAWLKTIAPDEDRDA
jgi:hypothetical protein